MEVSLTYISKQWLSGARASDLARVMNVSEREFYRIRKSDPILFPERKISAKSKLSDEGVELAAKMWAAGKTVSQIANATGVSINVLSGKMSRKRDLFPRRRDEDKPKEANLRRNTANKLRKLFSDSLKPHPIPKPKEEADAYDQSRMQYAVIFADLPNHCCKWPVTSHEKGLPNLFCAAPKAGKNYCSEHLARERRVS